MEKKIRRFKELLANHLAYAHAMNAISYDAETVMPRMGAENAARTIGFLNGEDYKIMTGDEMKTLVAELRENLSKLDAITAAEVKKIGEDLDRMSRIPMEEYIEYSMTVSTANTVWHDAKLGNDFKAFAPYLEKIIEFNRKKAGYVAPERPAYDVLLDEYEKGLTTETLDKYFALVRSKLAPLIEAIEKKPEIDDSALKVSFPIEKQRILARRIVDIMGIDMDRCALGEVEHPFTGGVNKYDIRLTTHYHEFDVLSGIFSIVHEGGHTIYEQNIGDEIALSPLGTGASMGIHESQSRFFENVIGRSREFIGLIYPVVCELFPEQMKSVSAEDMYRMANKANPGLIRIDADELTYSMHIMVRYELEKRLIAGDLKVNELPDAWNAMYKEYLGVDVPDDTHGVLQDSHWAGGSFGYFPSYSIGSAYAAQYYDSMMKDIDVPKLVKAGKIGCITEWFTKRIYRYGSSKTPDELILSACGKPFDPGYYIDYLTAKFTELYKL